MSAAEGLPPLTADADQMRTFLLALFRYADEGSFVSLRGFDQHDRNMPAILTEAHAIGQDVTDLADRAAKAADAVYAKGGVFAPPVATFKDRVRAREHDLANGVALSVDLDEGSPIAGRATLEWVLGPATVVMASGSVWADPETGELQPKMHAHWRLSEPTRTTADHARLKEARRLAAELVGADLSAAVPSHPLRWPGSFNVKAAPKMAKIIALKDSAEIDLGESLERLREACAARGIAPRAARPGGVERSPEGLQAPMEHIASAMAAIPNDAGVAWDEWNRIGMAVWAATGGSDDGLRTWEEWSAKSAKHTPGGCVGRWRHYPAHPPTTVGAHTIFAKAGEHGWSQFKMFGGVGDRRKPGDESAPSGSGKPAQVAPVPKGGKNSMEWTEDGVAQEFARQYVDKLRYCHHSQHWFEWKGSHWRREITKLAFSWARKVCRGMAAEANNNDKTRISKAAFAAAVEKFAQSDRDFAVTADVWDKDHWLLGTPDGTVDLRTGELRPADRKDLITKLTLVAPAVSGTACPRWMDFLDQATNGDKELQAFLQRLVGYCLTGDVTEEVLGFLYGAGGTGKGTFIGAIGAIMGDYAVAVPIEVFTAGSRLNLEYYRAQMAGARMVTASETEAGATWAESQIKEMSGNERPLSGRQPYGRVFEFQPQFKIILVGNHAPRLKGKSEAMERRMRIMPFNQKPSRPDHGLKDALKDEYPAIFRWMIDGCLQWQASRLGTCPAVAAETGSYFEQQDHFGRWLEERCNVVPSMSERPSKLFADFLAWAKESGEAPITSGEFRETVERTAGLRYGKSNGQLLVRGIGLKGDQSRFAASRASGSEGFYDR